MKQQEAASEPRQLVILNLARLAAVDKTISTKLSKDICNRMFITPKKDRL